MSYNKYVPPDQTIRDARLLAADAGRYVESHGDREEMNLSKSILRIFEVRAKAGKAEILQKKLSDTSVSVVKGKPGNLGYFFGENISSEDNDFVFISVWKDLESIKSHFGKDWEESFLPGGYEDIIESCSIKHMQVHGSLSL